MIINGKEITLVYNMKAIKAVQNHFGVDSFAGIPELLKTVSEDFVKMADFSVACIFHGCTEFGSIEEIESQVTSSEEIAPAAMEFIAAFNKFYGIKTTEKTQESGELEAPLTGSN